MALKVRHITTRFALLLGLAAVLPLMVYGAISILSLQRGTRESVVAGNQNVAMRAAEDQLPTTTFAIHLSHLNQPAGWLAGEFSLEEMWRMVDQIRIGDHGYAMVVVPDGELIAHGDPDKKALVAQARNMSGNALVQAVRAQRNSAPVSREYVDEDGRQELGVAAPIVPLGWTVIVEQPTAEAFASATKLQKQL